MKAKKVGVAALTALLAGCSHLPWIGGDSNKADRASAAAAKPAQAAPPDFKYQGTVSYVRLQPREPGSPPNEHPVVAYAGDMVRDRLARIVIPAQGDAPLLGPRELDEISTPIARALGYATPDQDVCFAVASPAVVGGAAQSITTGRVFRADGHLNVIVGLARRAMTAQMASARDFATGHRAAPSGEAVVAASADVAAATRGDWITFQSLTPAASSATQAPPSPAAGTATPVVSSTPGTSAPAPSAALPAEAAPVATPPAASPTIVSVPTSPIPPAAYGTVAERLQTLRKLLEDGLISQGEYNEKRRQIIGGL